MSKGAHRKESAEETEKIIKRGKIHRFNQHKPWTRAEEEIVTMMRRQGSTWREIGSELHRTKIAVYQHNKVVKQRQAEEREQRQIAKEEGLSDE